MYEVLKIVIHYTRCLNLMLFIKSVLNPSINLYHNFQI
jgi:hypothetical protein